MVGPITPMLHTKTQGHWPFGYIEEDFERFFTLYGHGSHLGHVTRNICANLRSPTLGSLHRKFELNWPRFLRKICLDYNVAAQNEQP